MKKLEFFRSLRSSKKKLWGILDIVENRYVQFTIITVRPNCSIAYVVIEKPVT